MRGEGTVEPDNPVWVDFAENMAPMAAGSAVAIAEMVVGRTAGPIRVLDITGSGEMFIRVGVAHEISARIRLAGDDPRQAADAVMEEVKAMDGSGGVIVVTANGDMITSFNSAGMYRGKADASGRSVAIFGDEERG